MSEELHDTATRTEHPGFDLRAAAQVVGDLARVEREAVLCVGPRRKWSDLQKLDEEINEAEQASAALSAELAQAFTQRQEEDARHTAELAAWLENGSRGDKPTSRADELDQRIPKLRAELAAREMARVRLRERRAAHIGKHRKRFASDMAREVAAAERRYRRIVDELAQRERNRRTSQRRGSSTRRGYDTHWQRLAAAAVRSQPWCFACRSREDLTVDHIHPESRGRRGLTLADVQVLCRSCNSRKGNRATGAGLSVSTMNRSNRPAAGPEKPNGGRCDAAGNPLSHLSSGPFMAEGGSAG